MLILGEELVLVATATDPELMRGSQVLQLGLNAAGLAELAARGQIQLASPYDLPGDKIATEMLDHSLLRQIRDQIISAGDYHPQRIIRGLRAPTVHTYLERLREDGILDWDAPKNPK